MSEPNEVDTLIGQIETIQRNCQHNYVVRGHRLPPSRRDGILLGSFAGSTIRFTILCSNCRKGTSVTAESTCPTCAGEMEKGELEPPEHYTEPYLYYAVRMFTCKKCDCHVGVEEWDQ